MKTSTSSRGNWGSAVGFVMAASGSAVGLGNLWKFPYITGEYGGGAFVLVYLICITVVGLPLLYAEIVIGKQGGKDVLGAIRSLVPQTGPIRLIVTNLTGYLAIITGFLILSFYSVVAGWALHFLAISLGFIPMDQGAAEAFKFVAGNGLVSSAWHTVFIFMTGIIVSMGVHEGIERLCKILMPSLIVILLALLIYCSVEMNISESLAFMFRPDFQKLSPEAIMEALGHAFFTLSIGMGAMLTYGSYIKSDEHIVRDGLFVALLDTAIALLAGVVIFSVVFHFGLKPSSGPGLIFMTLPDLFAQMFGGAIISSVFFLLVVFAAWSSAVSMLEVVVAYFVDERKMTRKLATWSMVGLIWLLGLGSAIHGPVLNFLDNLTTRYMLPIGGLLIAFIAGWLISHQARESGFHAFSIKWGNALAITWTVLIRFFVPLLVLFVFLAKLELIKL